jgi:hypothetical protein
MQLNFSCKQQLQKPKKLLMHVEATNEKRCSPSSLWKHLQQEKKEMTLLVVSMEAPNN